MHLWKLNIWQLSGLRKNRACLLFVTTWGGSQEAPRAQECGGDVSSSCLRHFSAPEGAAAQGRRPAQAYPCPARRSPDTSFNSHLSPAPSAIFIFLCR